MIDRRAGVGVGAGRSEWRLPRPQIAPSSRIVRVRLARTRAERDRGASLARARDDRKPHSTLSHVVARATRRGLEEKPAAVESATACLRDPEAVFDTARTLVRLGAHDRGVNGTSPRRRRRILLLRHVRARSAARSNSRPIGCSPAARGDAGTCGQDVRHVPGRSNSSDR